MMRLDENSWRVEVVGLSLTGLFHLERLSLSSEIQLVAAYDEVSEQRTIAAGVGCPVLDRSSFSAKSTNVAATIFADSISVDELSSSLVAGRHVVIHRPWLLSSEDLQSLHNIAVAAQRTATVACLHRWSADYATATSAIRTGRMGPLRSAQFHSYEQSLPVDKQFAGFLREFGYRWLDQLLAMTVSHPCRVYSTKLGDQAPQCDRGFVAIVDFEDGLTTQISANPSSRLGFRSGWMLEGSSGSYRNNKLYTVAPDGEIVDEPLQKPPHFDDPLIRELVALWRGNATSLPTLADAARVVLLIESIEESQASGKVVMPRWR